MRDEHLGEVYAAKEKIGEIQGMLASTTEQAEQLMDMVASATGGELCGSASGQAAFARTALVEDKINEVFRLLAEIVNELDAYAAEI